MPRLSDEERKNLVAYLDGELDAKTSLDLETRLNFDPAARAEVDELRQAWEMLDYLPRAEPSPAFTHRTLERLALQTGKLPHARLGLWWKLTWVAAIGLAFLVGFAAVRLCGPAPVDSPEIEHQLVRHLSAIEKVHLLEQVDSIAFLRELDHPELFGDEPGLAGQAVAPAPHNEVDNRIRLEAMTPDEREPLRQNAHYFLGLPAERRERIVKLDHDLHDLSQSGRQQSERVLAQYRQWLERLPAEDQAALEAAPDTKSRLEIVRQLRAEEWLKQQPAVVRNELARLSAEQRLGRVRKLRAEAVSRHRDWEIARRFWSDLGVGKPLPSRLEDFKGQEFADLSGYVKDYLSMMLTAAEKARLKRAEGHWPAYPRLLVELADAHPLALPGPRGPTRYMELPADVRRKLGKNKKDSTIKVRFMEGRWPQFAVHVTQQAAHRRGKQGPGLVLPFELWPYDVRGLSPRMKGFLEKELRPVLGEQEAARLRQVEQSRRWPDFPNTIQQLARKHDLAPPWQSLPGPEEYWDRFRMKPRALANR